MSNEPWSSKVFKSFRLRDGDRNRDRDRAISSHFVRTWIACNLIIIIRTDFSKDFTINAISKKKKKRRNYTNIFRRIRNISRISLTRNSFLIFWNRTWNSISFWTNDYILLIVQYNLHYLKIKCLFLMRRNQIKNLHCIIISVNSSNDIFLIITFIILDLISMIFHRIPFVLSNVPFVNFFNFTEQKFSLMHHYIIDISENITQISPQNLQILKYSGDEKIKLHH